MCFKQAFWRSACRASAPLTNQVIFHKIYDRNVIVGMKENALVDIHSKVSETSSSISGRQIVSSPFLTPSFVTTTSSGLAPVLVGFNSDFRVGESPNPRK